MDFREKRLFLGFDVISPWPEEFPEGRNILQKDRHITLLYIGRGDSSLWIRSLEKMFPFPMNVGISGIFDEAVFLPIQNPRVAAWHIRWMDGGVLYKELYQQAADWTASEHLQTERSSKLFCPHVTIARLPFSIASWRQAFSKRPLFLGNFHLYESLGDSHYATLWTRIVPPPFLEMEHTADLAFCVRGRTLQEVFLNAQIALCFHFSLLSDYVIFDQVFSLDEMIRLLNGIIARADAEQGCPFKAVSYHGILIQKDVLEWEMIVDV